jgi:hypothetical protein
LFISGIVVYAVSAMIAAFGAGQSTDMISGSLFAYRLVYFPVAFLAISYALAHDGYILSLAGPGLAFTVAVFSYLMTSLDHMTFTRDGYAVALPAAFLENLKYGASIIGVGLGVSAVLMIASLGSFLSASRKYEVRIPQALEAAIGLFITDFLGVVVVGGCTWSRIFFKKELMEDRASAFKALRMFSEILDVGLHIIALATTAVIVGWYSDVILKAYLS